MLALAALAALAGGARGAPAGFDHATHAARAGAPIACARCHAGASGLARPGHAACFTDCHGGGAGRGKLEIGSRDRAAACAVCHADPAAAHPPAPFPIGRDLAPSLGHASHAAVPCAQCHASTSRKPHARCAGCHDGAAGHGAAIAACESCHVASRPPPRVARADIPLAYSHPRHAARAGAAPCTTCHTGLDAITAGQPLPRAPRAACETCHDGKAAFTTGTACTRCHDAAPATAWTPPKPGPRFSHVKHGDAATACAGCHALASSGEPTVAHHDACAGAACHVLHPEPRPPGAAPDAGDDKAICGACHEGTEPWRHLVADRAPADATELGASLDHGVHRGECTSCHVRRAEASELRMPHGHAACAGTGCHALAGGPAPALASCDGCHRLGLAAERLATRLAAPWSVRAAFDHARHGSRAKLACGECHTALDGAQLLATPTPAKATCAPCHDGHGAFKLTGTTCRKCHARGLTP